MEALMDVVKRMENPVSGKGTETGDRDGARTRAAAAAAKVCGRHFPARIDLTREAAWCRLEVLPRLLANGIYGMPK